MTGRREESDLAWRPPNNGPETQGDGHDFGPSAELGVSHLDEDAATDSTGHPEASSAAEASQSGPHQVNAGQSGPHQVNPSQSGPHQVNPGQSGPHQVSASQSGPHQVNPSQSGPHYVNPNQSGPHNVNPGQSGPHQVSASQSGPHYVNPNQSGPHNVNPSQSGPHHVNPGQSGPHQVGQSYPQGQQYGYPQAGRPQDGGHGHDLSSARLIKQNKRAPQSGWRKAVFVASGHLINPGESPTDVRRRELIGRVNQPLRGCYKIAMLSLKGGVGKTTTTTTLGSTFSSLRGDRVIAVDANPDRGTLSQKIPLETTATVRHLLRDADRIRRYSDIRAYTSQGPSRLEVLASEQDPAVSEAFSEQDYRRTVTLLEHFYNIVLTDCGTGLMHSAMKGVLDIADSLVIVSSGSVDGARSASATLDWLDAHGYRDLVSRSVAVINSVRPKSGSVDLDKLAQHFGSRCRAVCRIPFDPHLEEGAEIELDRLAPETRLALLEMAATVADDFPR
ncbi:MinD-like ATPase involved in chromosome partitioning or flagellar assembly [Actinokineospora alba]|uniref:MinD-like ATPase involved in chromosome partitioning or flagellar assembly n=1 Tax=Actinokineospora alba TaxID=504798 RepID=A0A1H0WPD4_9PSEU|nr:MinD/ParA family protein [Actinokineospora alba]TDP65666.1 MinD-like ATPase involved in chromosome partitioning or flagellar assembly [Actinokineospora alba]SDJ54884.1 MinD-like ATPase involved in chromosome partitioning or flagellar assembly [Actinokineospora alba]SDP92528.1 MinD-like ATPase involved in chromosome partitioning or flagellar assembly [Actinokineospora alba]